GGAGPPVAWAVGFGDGADQVGASVARDPSGDVLVLGRFAGNVEIGGKTLKSAGSLDVFVARLDRAGEPLWSKRYGDAGEQFAKSVAQNASGETLIAGYFDGTIDIDPDKPMTSKGGQDIFVAKLSATGAHVW